MGDIKIWVPTGLLVSAFSLLLYFAARSKVFKNGELFVSTPEYDMENVKSKHFKLRIALFLMNFLPTVLLFVLTILLKQYINNDIYLAMVSASRQYLWATIAMLFVFLICAKGVNPGRTWEFFEEPYILTRYMIYPKLSVSAGAMTGIVWSFAGGIAGFAYSFFESNITIRNGMDFPFGVLCFVMELLLVYLANYAIISWYDNTSNDFLFDKVDYEEYDKAAKRYYGIWRNRLILANLMAGSQLILGGFVTLTNAGEHLMGIRILGLILLVAVFSYILIQSREFDDPVVVKGMVYPSEKKRVTTKWVILSAIALYILGAIILL